ncbi:hypothetical protein BRADI_1g62061v3 [Brachypodium distachyon]|uniref:Uncharacterized protein n=1 Tax=Brachypodium distachyon TaxID=15368 RepID=A0A2K2DT06_BRADI|nr:hypothetical protein BRADI_1g62061v3 [Brachypodium distachyon]
MNCVLSSPPTPSFHLPHARFSLPSITHTPSASALNFQRRVVQGTTLGKILAGSSSVAQSKTLKRSYLGDQREWTRRPDCFSCHQLQTACSP